MNVLLLGSGGREHALAWKLAQSPLVERLIVAPGNAGIGTVAELKALDIADHAAVIALCKAEKIDYVVVGPEAPLVAGIVDDLAAAGIEAFGPDRAAAQLEGSKRFTKDLCKRHSIPTAAYETFTEAAAAKAYVREKGAPIVIKADGLAAGKGVVVAASLAEAEAAIDMMAEGGLGAAGATIVVEEMLVGEEASFFALCDGETALPLASAQDHKRAFDNDEGPNTGGMGAYSPAPVMDAAMEARVMEEIVLPTLAGMKAEGMPFKGVLFAGLMITAEGPKLIEYNTRFGDPECEVLMPRLQGDLFPLLRAATHGTLAGRSATWRKEAALTVILATKGYPGAYGKGSEIRGLERAAALGAEVFHAGTIAQDGRILANGGRVLAVTALGATVSEAQTLAYRAVDAIDWPDGFCRRDIGARAVARERG